MNRLEIFRTESGLTYEALGNKAGFAKHVAWKHCHASKIPAESAAKYSDTLGIPRSELRPDLWPPTAAPATSPSREEVGGDAA